jgi:hypothetical protein
MALLLILVVAIGAGIASGATLPGVKSTIETPNPTAAGSSFGSPTPNLAGITPLLEINARLQDARGALVVELAASTFEPSNVASILRGINADVVEGLDISSRVPWPPSTRRLAFTLADTYQRLYDLITAALNNSVQNAKAYQTAAAAVVTRLGQLAFLDQLLAQAQAALPSGSPAASAAPPPSEIASPTPVPASPTPSAGGSVPPSTGPPPVNVVVNPGFETGIGSPWELVLASAGAATLKVDHTVQASGTSSARVDISAAGDERAAVVVRQGGLAIEAGSHYIASVSVRAETTREVRFRIASADGTTYQTRLFTVGPIWQVLRMELTPFANDPNAYLEIDLGRFAASTWLDDASFGRVAPTAS